MTTQITPHVHVCHVDDGAVGHPGGSNNYFVGDPGEEMILIDAGQHDREWTQQILDCYEELGCPKITSIAITHGHADHYGGLDRLFDVMRAPVRCHPKLAKTLWTLVPKESVVPVRSREVLRTGGGVALRCLFTPGHSVDHVCYYFAQERVLFTGDTILGSSSATMGDLFSYMKSLQLLIRLRHDVICPAHGAIVPPPRGRRLAQWYMDHRNEREQQVLDALQKGLNNVDDMVRDIYPKNLKRGLRAGAARNIHTHLEKLIKDGRVEEVKPTYRLKS